MLFFTFLILISKTKFTLYHKSLKKKYINFLMYRNLLQRIRQRTGVGGEQFIYYEVHKKNKTSSCSENKINL